LLGYEYRQFIQRAAAPPTPVERMSQRAPAGLAKTLDFCSMRGKFVFWRNSSMNSRLFGGKRDKPNAILTDANAVRKVQHKDAPRRC
jgi:hypothetical protein